MSGIVAISLFGASLVGVGLLENAGVKVNQGALRLVMECVKYGAVLYILKMAFNLFL